jgi:hypothetical protein
MGKNGYPVPVVGWGPDNRTRSGTAVDLDRGAVNIGLDE